MNDQNPDTTGAGKADDLHPVSRTAAPRLYSMFQRTDIFGLPIRENRQVFFRKNKKHTRYGKEIHFNRQMPYQ